MYYKEENNYSRVSQRLVLYDNEGLRLAVCCQSLCTEAWYPLASSKSSTLILIGAVTPLSCNDLAMPVVILLSSSGVLHSRPQPRTRTDMSVGARVGARVGTRICVSSVGVWMFARICVSSVGLWVCACEQVSACFCMLDASVCMGPVVQ
jgi:hypothetical protein